MERQKLSHKLLQAHIWSCSEHKCYFSYLGVISYTFLSIKPPLCAQFPAVTVRWSIYPSEQSHTFIVSQSSCSFFLPHVPFNHSVFPISSASADSSAVAATSVWTSAEFVSLLSKGRSSSHREHPEESKCPKLSDR